MYINLLSLEHQRRQVVQTRVWQWALVWVAAMPILFAVGCWQWNRYRESARKLAGVQQQHAPLERVKQENEELTARLAMLRQREQLVLELAEGLSVVDLLGQVSQAAAASGGGVSVRHFAVVPDSGNEPRRAAGGGRSSARSTPSRGMLTLQGVGVDNASVAEFVSQLRDSTAFTNVHLTSTAPVMVNSREARNYQLQCTY